MDVSESNFEEMLVLIKDAIDEADFLAIDTELTGVDDVKNLNSFDTPEERYFSIKESTSKFQMIQFGLSAFHYETAQDKYLHKDFNIYVFPHPYCEIAPDNIFTVHTSSIAFLSSQGFNFNKLFSEGISYLTPAQENAIRERLEERHKEQKESLTPSRNKNRNNGDSSSMENISDECQQFLQQVHRDIDRLLLSDEESISLNPCNSFLRRLVYISVKEKHPSGLDISTEGNNKMEKYIVISKATDDDKVKNLVSRQRTELQNLDQAVGFRKVLELISNSNKLIVGHNMLLDLMHMISVFSSPLPKSYEEFKEIVSCLFPNIMDTKHISSAAPFKDYFTCTALEELLKQIQDKVFRLAKIEPADVSKGYSTEQKQLHEAGYDAFITGICFIGLSNRIGFLQGPPQKRVHPGSPLLKPYVNKLFLMKNYDISYINLQGPDVIPCREHVFHITFPKEWKRVDIFQLFSPYGNVFISWINDTSAFVALRNSTEVPNVIKNLTQSRNNIYTVQTYTRYQEKKKMRMEWSKNQAVPHADVNLPTKRKHSTENLEVSSSSRLIETIPEEEESKDRDEPQPKIKRNNSDDCKMFEETDNWT